MTSPETIERLRILAAQPGARVEPVEIEGATYWIKRPETLGLRMRLQKGDPSRAFAEEVAAHQDFARKGLPVAPVVLASATYLVTEDCGCPLRSMAWEGAADFPKALAAAAKALAALHGAGAAHGRPSLKDICWHDGRIAFLDLERAGRARDLGRARGMDLLILIFSSAVETGGDRRAMEIARDAYLAAGDGAVWQAAQARARRYAPLVHLTWPIRKVLKNNREWAAVGVFWGFMRG